MFYTAFEPSVFDILYMSYLVKEYTGSALDVNLDMDVFWEYWHEAIEFCADAEIRFIEEYDETLFTFHDSFLSEYFTLCSEYGKRHHVRYRDNPHVRAALQFTRQAMQFPSYCYDWDLRYSPKAGHHATLLFTIGPEFYEPVQALEGILSVLRFFREGVKTLKAELCATVAQSGTVSTERQAA